MAVMDKLTTFNEIANTIEKKMLPHGCECVLCNDISINIIITTRSEPCRKLVVPGVYLPSLRSSEAIERLVDELWCGIEASE